MRLRVPLDPDRASLRRGALRGAWWAVLEKFGTRAASLATFVVLARLLDPDDFGLVALSAVLVTLVSLFMDLNFGQYLVQQLDLRRQVIDCAFWLSVVSGIVVMAILVACAPVLAFALDEPRLRLVLIVLAGTVPLGALTAIPQALLRRSLAFDVITLRGLVGIGASSVVGISMALAGAGVWALVAQMYAQNLASLVLFFGFAGWHPRFAWDRRAARDMLRYGRDLWGMGFLQFLQTRGDEFVLGVVAGAHTLGIYSVAKRAVLFLTDLAGGVVLHVGPAVLAAAKDDHARVRRGYLLGCAATVVTVVPVTMALAAVGGVLVPLVFGAQWALAGPVTQVIAVGAGVAVLIQLDRGLFLALDLPRVELRSMAVTAVGGLIVGAVAATQGLLAFAISGTLWSYAAWLWRTRVVRRRAEIPSRSILSIVVPVWLAAAFSGGAAWLALSSATSWNEWAAVAVGVVTAVALYPVLLRLIAREAVDLLRNLPVSGRWAPYVLLASRVLLGRSTGARRTARG